MPFPIDVTRCLAFSETGTPLRVATIPFAPLRAKLASRGLRERDEIVVELLADAPVVLAKRDGSRVLVERQYAVMIEVAPCAVSPTQSPRASRRTVRRPLIAVEA